jgi:hypothetical protein
MLYGRAISGLMVISIITDVNVDHHKDKFRKY